MRARHLLGPASILATAATIVLGLAWLGPAAEARWASLPWFLLAAVAIVALVPPLLVTRRIVAARRAADRPTRGLRLFGMLLLLWNVAASAAIVGLTDRATLSSVGARWVTDRIRGRSSDPPAPVEARSAVASSSSTPAVSSVPPAVGEEPRSSIKIFMHTTRVEGDGGGADHVYEVRKELRTGCARAGADGLEVLMTADGSPCCALPPSDPPRDSFLSSKVGPGGVAGAFGHTVAAPTQMFVDTADAAGFGGLGEYAPWATELTLEAVPLEAGRRVRGRMALSLKRADRWSNGELTIDGSFDVALCARPDLDKITDGFKVKPAKPGRLSGAFDGGRTTFEASTVLALRRKSRLDPVDFFELAFYDAPTTCEDARAGRGPRPRFFLTPALPRDPSRAVGITVAATLVRKDPHDTGFAWVALSRAEARDGGTFAGTAAAWRDGDDTKKVDLSGSFEAPTCAEASP